MSPAKLRRQILDGQPVEDHQLLVLLWGKGNGSASDAMAARAAALLESTGGLEGWVDSTNSENLRRQGVSEARAARLLAAAEIARRTRTARRPRFEAITRSALELVAVTLEAIVDDPSPHEVGLCIEMIRALQRTSFTLAQGLASAGPLSGELLDQLDDQTL